MGTKNASRTIGIFLALSIQPPTALATYQVWCGSVQVSATNISSVFGEIRDDSDPPDGKPDRFHAGVDIANGPCQTAGANVMPIDSGTVQVTNIPTCTSHCIRIYSLNASRAFDYVDIDVPLGFVDGSTVTAGTTIIGHIQNLGADTHLHLNEIRRIGETKFLANPQRPNAVVFNSKV